MTIKRQKVIRAAEKYVARGKIEAGIEEYRKVLAENPDDTSTLNRVGDLYARISRIDEAIELFHQIAEQYSADGFLVKAIAIYKKIIKLDPTRLAVYESLAELYHRQGLINEARTQYQVLADYYRKHDDDAAAINIFEKMAELEPSDPSPHLELAELYEASEVWDEAMRQYRTIADLMLEHERVDEAVAVYERVIERRSEDVDFIGDAVLGLKDAGHVGAAARVLNRLMEVNPEAERVAELAGMEPGRSEAATTSVAEDAVAEAIEDDRAEDEAAATAEPAVEPESEVPATTPEPEELDVDGEPATREESPGMEYDEEEDAFVLDIEGEPGAVEGAPGSLERELTPPEEIDWRFDDEPGETPTEMPSSPGESEPERAAGEGEPPTGATLDQPVSEGPSARDLLSEAEVLAKYGLEEKALDRLRSVVSLTPRELDAHELMASIYLRQGESERAASAADRLRRLTEELDEPARWERLESRLLDAGFSRGEDGRIVPPHEPGEEERVAEMLESIVADEEVEAPTAEPDRMAGLDQRLEEIAAEVSTAAGAPPVEDADVEPEEVVVEPAAPEPREEAVAELPDDDAGPEPSSITPPEESDAVAADAVDEETGIHWLEEKGDASAEESLFDEEEDFFDLAAELEEELEREEGGLDDDVLVQQAEPSLEEIVDGFKRGVAENLSQEDFDTHYNLGIAYREMGLLDEAIGEFQLASKDPEYFVSCCSMLGVSFLEKGLPQLAVKWYGRALDAPDVAEETACDLLYQMGNAHLEAGDRESAYRTFVELYGVNSNYRDVVAKLEELNPGRMPRDVEAETDVEA